MFANFVEVFPKILSEAALCLAVFCLHYFIEDQVRTSSETLLQLDEGLGLDFMKRKVSFSSLRNYHLKFYLFLLQIILLGSILTVAKLLQLSSFSLLSRVSPATDIHRHDLGLLQDQGKPKHGGIPVSPQCSPRCSSALLCGGRHLLGYL